MFRKIKLEISLFWQKREWRKRNRHNRTWLVSMCDIEKVKVGKETYGPLDIRSYGVNGESLIIGNFCSIAGYVTFMLGGEHNYKTPSTYPYKVNILGRNAEALTKGAIIVDDDVWIGEGARIMSGVHIHQGAVIGSDSVVTKDIPPYAIYAGHKIVKYRFDEETIKKMLRLDYSKIEKKDIEENIDLLYEELKDSFFESDFYQNHLKRAEQ